jgi:carbon monoxide dehydrogenase subunit G
MELQGEQRIQAPRDEVWRALNDPGVLARCVPGCEEMRRVSDTELEARLLAKVGPVRAHFSGRIVMLDVVPPESCLIAFQGSGGAAGMATGESKVTLIPDGGGTRLTYTVQAAVGGKLGQIGGRLINASARKMADEFFQALNEQLTPSAVQAVRAVQAGQGMSDTPSGNAPGVRAYATSASPDMADSPARAQPAYPPAMPVRASGGLGWAAEAQRVLWLAIGIGIGWVASRGLPF